jgi:hypothetical protein
MPWRMYFNTSKDWRPCEPGADGGGDGLAAG